MSSPSLPLVIGSFGLTQTVGTKIRTDATKETITRIYNGTGDQCLAGTPAMGSTFSDLPGEVIVVGTLLEVTGGGKGTLTIDLETPYETTYECEWVEVDEVLEKNPRYWCAAAGDPADGPYSLTPQDRAMLERWKQEEDAVLRMSFLFKIAQNNTTMLASIGNANPISSFPFTATQFGGQTLVITLGPSVTTPTIASIPYNLYQLSANAQDYAVKWLRGTEQYRLYAPVIRETSESFDPPASGPCGVLENPPSEAGDIIPSASELTGLPYVWQRSAQRIIRTGPYGKYRMQREWQGADYIDVDLYGAAT
jgi:hypothetical protein